MVMAYWKTDVQEKIIRKYFRRKMTKRIGTQCLLPTILVCFNGVYFLQYWYVLIGYVITP